MEHVLRSFGLVFTDRTRFWFRQHEKEKKKKKIRKIRIARLWPPLTKPLFVNWRYSSIIRFRLVSGQNSRPMTKRNNAKGSDAEKYYYSWSRYTYGRTARFFFFFTETYFKYFTKIRSFRVIFFHVYTADFQPRKTGDITFVVTSVFFFSFLFFILFLFSRRIFVSLSPYARAITTCTRQWRRLR